MQVESDMEQGRFGAGRLARPAALMIAAVIFNIALGRLVRDVLDWPLYLDSIGSILVGALLGPLAGAAVGALSNVIWALAWDAQPLLAYSLTAAFVGWAAGYAATRGAFNRFSSVLWSGLLVGIGAALISAPITAYLFADITGSGLDALTPFLRATGANILQTATIEGFLSDPIDKMLSFALAWLAWRPLAAYFPPLSRRGAPAIESLRGYSLAVAAILLTALLSFVFLPALGRGVFAFFYLAVLLSAWRGGLGPALLATAAGAAANLVFLLAPPAGMAVSAEDWVRLLIFVIVSIVIAVIADRLERSKRELQAALQAEQESEARIRAITEGVTEALALISSDGRVLNVNRRFEEIFGAPRERVVGQRVEDIRTLFDQVFPDTPDIYNLMTSGGGDAERQDSRFVNQRWPEPRELHLFSAPVRTDGQLLGRLFVFRDVTREREVDRMKTEFVSLVSHELRTPLTSIKGFTQMVLEGDAGEINEEVQEFLGIALNNTDRLIALVNDLLDISRIESGRVQLKSEAVDLNAAVETVAATMQGKLREKEQQLAVSVDPAATCVTGDRDKLVQVLTNYVSNAHKYTEPGGSIRVVVSRQGDFARVAVSDNGHGIAPEDQARLFSRFYRVDNEMTREVGGTGLGLSIVKQLIELQGGEVGVQSELGAGSTFTFTIPLSTAPNQEVEHVRESTGSG
jgi:PAS domain S-box-containing protein